jgi:hypothetical protein
MKELGPMQDTAMPPSFEALANFIRSWAQISEAKQISSRTAIEEDLSITGDDGVDLLEAIERKYGVEFESDDGSLRETFNLGPNEFLFHPEGFSILRQQFELTTLFGSAPDCVRPLTVGQLHEVVVHLLERDRQS